MSSPSSSSSGDSLFDGSDDDINAHRTAAQSSAPIPGLYVFPSLLPLDVSQTSLEQIANADHFIGGSRDQVMLFSARGSSGLPSHIQELDARLRDLLTPLLPPDVLTLAFKQDLGRQAILNLYPPGCGISPHIDLPSRYADGIVGVSLTGGCVMSFERVAVDSSGYKVGEVEQVHEVYLPPRSAYVLSGEARWGWAHGIAERVEDVVDDGSGGVRTLPRSLRVSVTFRWLLEEGAVLS